jgi:hypothetical protein
MILCSVDEEPGAPPEVDALSLDDEPTWSRLEPSGNPPERIASNAVVYDAVGQRLIFIEVSGFGTAATALELGDAPAWHTFCSRGTRRRPVFRCHRSCWCPTGYSSTSRARRSVSISRRPTAIDAFGSISRITARLFSSISDFTA